MNKNTILILGVTLSLLVLWIGYNLYSSLFIEKYKVNSENIDSYLLPVTTEMYLDSLNKLSLEGGNIKVTKDSLK